MKKILMKILFLFCLIYLLLPPVEPFSNWLTVFPKSSLAIWIIYIMQLFCIILFLTYKTKWSEWLFKRVEILELPTKEKYTESLYCLFFCGSFALFTGVFPAVLYMNDEENSTLIVFLLLMGVFIWHEIFFTPMYQIFTGDKEMPPVRWRIPFMSLSVFAVLAFKISFPFTSSRATGFYFLLLFFELLMLIRIRIWILRRRNASK